MNKSTKSMLISIIVTFLGGAIGFILDDTFEIKNAPIFWIIGYFTASLSVYFSLIDYSKNS